MNKLPMRSCDSEQEEGTLCNLLMKRSFDEEQTWQKQAVNSQERKLYSWKKMESFYDI